MVRGRTNPGSAGTACLPYILWHHCGLVKMMAWVMNNVLGWMLFLCVKVHQERGSIHLPISTVVVSRYVEERSGGFRVGGFVRAVEDSCPLWYQLPHQCCKMGIQVSEKPIPKPWPTSWLSEPPGLNLAREVAKRLRSLLPGSAGFSAQAALKEPQFRGKLSLQQGSSRVFL